MGFSWASSSSCAQNQINITSGKRLILLLDHPSLVLISIVKAEDKEAYTLLSFSSTGKKLGETEQTYKLFHLQEEE